MVMNSMIMPGMSEEVVEEAEPTLKELHHEDLELLVAFYNQHFHPDRDMNKRIKRMRRLADEAITAYFKKHNIK